MVMSIEKRAYALHKIYNGFVQTNRFGAGIWMNEMPEFIWSMRTRSGNSTTERVDDCERLEVDSVHTCILNSSYGIMHSITVLSDTSVHDETIQRYERFITRREVAKGLKTT